MTDTITGYHAHVYFDADSEPTALALRDRIAAGLEVEVGRVHRKPVGPHPHWSYQLAFTPERFGAVVPFLMLNRGGLDVLVHPRTGDEIRDHFDSAMWLGEKAALIREPLLPKKRPASG
jgi:DOPA 4,5-dioxygenase